MPLIDDVYMIHCWNCNCYTKTIEPIIIKRFGVDKIKVTGCCDKCKIGKVRNYFHNLPNEWHKIPLNHIYGNNIIYGNGESVKILDIFDKYINSMKAMDRRSITMV